MVEFLLELVCDVDVNEVKVLRQDFVSKCELFSHLRNTPCNYSSPVSAVDTRTGP